MTELDAVKNYLNSHSNKTPYFLFVSDEQYLLVKDELMGLGLAFVKVSNYCSDDDKLPDIDDLLEHVNNLANDKKEVVLGLGEYLALRGSVEATKQLSLLKDMSIGGAKVVLLLRGLVSQIADLGKDPRFDSPRRFNVIDDAACDLSFTLATPIVRLSAFTGFKTLLTELENGRCGRVVVNTMVHLTDELFNVNKITNAYDGVKLSLPELNLPHSYGRDDQWSELLTELNKSNDSLDEVFEKNGVSANPEADFRTRLQDNEYRRWLYFIALKYKFATLTNGYLKFVLDKTNHFESLKKNILNAIIDVSHTDVRFAKFYTERKTLLEKFPESDIADFVINNRKNPAESVYKLTDGTMVEREEVITWISQYGFDPHIANIYPALAAYISKYLFRNDKFPELAELLTEYFDAYKRQKVANRLEPEFLTQVDELARSRMFNLLPTRSEILDRVDQTDTFLYWLDALGVEYLAFIEKLVQQRGLSISIHIARAELPTITSKNNDFYEPWPDSRKEKNSNLDEIKHKATSRYNFVNNALPIHLAQELDIITMIIDSAATKLALQHYKRFLIVSDHGASRLAVLRRKEEQYETDTKGEHSGRCCKWFEPYQLSYACEENGYLVLANYGRFKGSRAANVEVHGGASLEEVVIPVIELMLKAEISVKLVDDVVTVDPRCGTEIRLFINSPAKNVSIVLHGKRYFASQTDAHHYNVALPDTKRAGEYVADVYAGDDLIGQILITTQGKSGKVNDAFDKLF